MDAARTVAFASSNDHWLPVKAIQWLLDVVHLSTGLPWWASIVAATLCVRALLFPLAVIQYRNGARLTLMRPEMMELTNSFRSRMQTEGGVSMTERLQHKERMKQLMLRHRCNPLYSLVMPLVLAPVFLSFFSGIRSMQDLHPSFTSGGLYHFADLSAADPYYVLPIINSITMLIPMEFLPDPNAMQEKDRQRMKLVFRGVAVLFIFLGQSMPAGLFVYWISSNIFTILQQMVLRTSWVRRLLGIPDVSVMAATQMPSPLDWVFGKQKEEGGGGVGGAAPVAANVKEAVVLRNEKAAVKTSQAPVQMFQKPRKAPRQP